LSGVALIRALSARQPRRTLHNAVICTPSATKHYLIVQRVRAKGFLVLDCMSRAAKAIDAVAG
jgi:hypothetical protein